MGVKFIIKAPWQHFIAVISPRHIEFALQDPGAGEPWFQLEGQMHGEDDPLWQCIRELTARRSQGEIELTGGEAKAFADMVFEAVWAVGWRALAGEDAFALTHPEMRGRINVELAGRLIPALAPSERERLLIALAMLQGLHPSWFAPAVPGLRERVYPFVRPEKAEDVEGQVWLEFREDNDLWERFRAKREWGEPSLWQTWLQGLHNIAQRLVWRVRWREEKREERSEAREATVNDEVKLGDGEALILEVMADPQAIDPEAMIENRERLEELLAPLTPREQAVATLLAQGLKQKDVAETLGITRARVSEIVASLRKKLKKIT